MEQLARRLFVIGATSAALMLTVPSSASAATASPVSHTPPVQTQTFTGNGTGTYDTSFRDNPTYDGHYATTGQLGSGKFAIGTGLGRTALFTRSDGARFESTSIVNTPSECDPADTMSECYRVDVTGSSDVVSARIHVHAELSFGTTGPLNAYVTTFTFSGSLVLTHRIGYSMLLANGRVDTFGGLVHLGDAPTANAVDVERTPSANGYWVVNRMGQVYAYGDAPYLGGLAPGSLATGEVVTSMTSTPTGRGYWLFTSRGMAVTFGDAHNFGDLRSTPLNGDIVGSVATPTGQGYYMVGSDGGVFAFGDARFHGSMGGTHLNQPVVGLVPTADNLGYWLVAADGGVFSLGDARFHGSMGGTRLNRPIVAMVPYGTAYLMIASDGGVFDFSTLPFFGSDGATAIPVPVVNGTAAS